MSSSRSSKFAIFTVILGLATVENEAQAQAGEDEIFLTAGPEFAATPNFRSGNRGVGGSVAAFWGFHELWSVGGQLGYSRHFQLPTAEDGPSGNVFSAFVGPSFNLDVLAVVPFISVMPGLYVDDDLLGPGNAHFGVRGALGFDYRPSRNFAVGADVAWHVVANVWEGFPGYSVVRIRLSYIWDLRAL
ncbi:MAG: hypothetical protein ACJAYU_004113 [Bradymonadia bacterium]